MPQWQREYIEGSQLEVYMVRLPERFHGLSFHQACTKSVHVAYLYIWTALSFPPLTNRPTNP